MTHDMQPDASLEAPRPIAPWLHTVAILALLAVSAIAGSRRASPSSSGHPLRYITTAMTLWMLLGSVVAGIYHRRHFFSDTLRRNIQAWYIDAGWGALFYVVTFVVLAAVGGLLGNILPSHDNTVVEAMAPKTAGELAIWLGVSISAGFCEEHIFRGYLLKQSMAWGLRLGASSLLASIAAVVTTSLIFGAMHLYQGFSSAILITLLGSFSALAALQFKNLRAVIVAHILQDFIGFAILLHRSTHSH